MTQENPAIARRNRTVALRPRTHPEKFLLRHDQKKLVLRFGQNDEFFRTVAAPAGRDGDPVFFVNGVTEFAGEEFLWLSGIVHTPADRCAISIHFPPLLTTLRAMGQYKLMPIAPLFPPRKLSHGSPRYSRSASHWLGRLFGSPQCPTRARVTASGSRHRLDECRRDQNDLRIRRA